MPGVRSAAILLVLSVVCFGNAAPPDNCAVTKSPAQVFVPPPPHDALPPSGTFWFGSDDLWLFLPNDGVWDTLHDGPTYDRRKIAWFSREYWWQSEPQPKLLVDGKRLDGPAKPIHMTWATNAFLSGRQESFMFSGIEFPAIGCWEIAANYHGHELKFVVWVTP